MATICGKKDHGAGAGSGHFRHDGVGSVEHGIATDGDVLHHHAFEHRQVFHGGDVVQPQVVAAADVGDHCHRAAVKTQAFTQHATARNFKHRSIDIGVHQHIAGTFWPAAVAAVGLPAVHVNAIGVGHAHTPAVGCQHMRNQPRGGGFAVGAGHGNHRNAAVVVVCRGSGRKQLIDHGHSHCPSFAIGGRNVHAKTGCGVHLDNAALLGFQRLQHGFTNDVDTANMQAHHLRGSHSPGGQRRVHIVRHIRGGAARAEVGVVAQHHALAFDRHGFWCHVLGRQAHHGNVVKPDFGQRGGMALAASGVLVDQIDQLPHGVKAITHHLRRLPAGCRHHGVAHHQQAVVAAGEEFFNHDLAMFGC